jgi:hypothetical protein
MKKTLLTCLAIVAVFAVASSASAVTCTIDQRPAATLLVPYFQVSYDADGNLISTGPGARDTIVTIGNASAAPMIAHVNVYNRFSQLVLDFNIALTGFDLQAMRVSDVIGGILPNTPLDFDGEPLGDVCQRAGGAVYPDLDGFLRVSPLFPATPLDNTLATTQYDQVFFSVAEQLREDCGGDLDLLAIGYMAIDHANYCNLSDPTLPNYYYNNALGNENNLFGEIVFTSGEGLPTYAMSTVNLEADTVIGQIALNDPFPVPRSTPGTGSSLRTRPTTARTAARAIRRPTSRSARPGTSRAALSSRVSATVVSRSASSGPPGGSTSV